MIKKKKLKKKKKTNYSKLTCGLVHLHFLYPLFKTKLFVRLCFNSFAPTLSIHCLKLNSLSIFASIHLLPVNHLTFRRLKYNLLHYNFTLELLL